MPEIDPLAARLGAEISATQQVVGVLLAHLAMTHDDPEDFILSLTEMLSPEAEEARAADPAERMLAEAMQAALSKVERVALAALPD